ncbi:hypothetical protein EGX80_08360 [Streptococcus pyogenes]|nr:hypothetical protein DMC40_06255 [Streptococcus pyogenes]AYZ10067.1 hypothetical protein EGX80_08360 [Streptococcus pyogenes]BBB88664.1 hypothetical protein SPYKS030_12810 [Streptococcus pyogenes]
MFILCNGFFQRCFFAEMLLCRDASFKRSSLGFFSAKYLAYLHSLMSYKNTPNVRFFYLTFGV